MRNIVDGYRVFLRDVTAVMLIYLNIGTATMSRCTQLILLFRWKNRVPDHVSENILLAESALADVIVLYHRVTIVSTIRQIQCVAKMPVSQNIACECLMFKDTF